MFGYAGKMLFVNLSEGTLEERPLTEQLLRDFMGGPGLGAKILYDEMPAHTHPFAEDSIVGFISGPLNATGALFGGRYTVVSKSPVTGGWNDANSGGKFGPSLKKAGYDAVFVKGIAQSPACILIDNGKAQIRSAKDIWGLTVDDAEKAFSEEFGDDLDMALIGPAGERCSYMAAVMNDSHRAAARGGTGAVMGSKKLKAIVVRGKMKIQIADKDALRSANKTVVQTMKGPGATASANFGNFGTGGALTETAVVVSDAGMKNWSGTSSVHFSAEDARAISPVTLDDTYKVKKYACAACPLGCGAIYKVPDGKGGYAYLPRPEYETIGTLGSMTLNTDPLSIIFCNHLCNQYGLDTMSVGSTIAWAMDCYNAGILTSSDLDDIDLTWGNAQAIKALTEKICKGEGCGEILQMGSAYAAKEYDKGFEKLVTADGIEIPQHDARWAPGLSRIYQYDPTPGRHVKGGFSIASGRQPHEIKYDYSIDTGEIDAKMMAIREIDNSSGLCLLSGTVSVSIETKMAQINAVTGFGYAPQEIRKLGLRLFNMRHAFNLREGIRRTDHRLSRRAVKADPPFAGPIAGVLVDHERLADYFFKAIGWSKDMMPDKKMLNEIGGMEFLIEDLYGKAATV